MSDITGTNPESAPQTTSTPAPASTPSTPSTVQVTPDSVLEFDGQKVPFSKFRGIESEYTKATQARAQLEKQLTEARQQAQQYQQQIQQFRNVAGGQRQDPAAETIAKLRSLTYLSGEEAAGVVEQIIAANRQQQSIAYLLAKRIADLEQSLSGVRGQYASQSFGQKIAGFREQLQIPERFQKRLEELYLAYEGDDLDQEFPKIAKEWYDDISAAFTEAQKAKLEQARRGPFVPGRGGQGSPSKPLDFTGAESVAEQAQKAFDAFGLGSKD